MVVRFMGNVVHPDRLARYHDLVREEIATEPSAQVRRCAGAHVRKCLRA